MMNAWLTFKLTPHKYIVYVSTRNNHHHNDTYPSQTQTLINVQTNNYCKTNSVIAFHYYPLKFVLSLSYETSCLFFFL